MKKTFLFILLFAILLSSTVVFADGSYIYLKDLELSCSVPENLNVITRETSASDPVYSILGLNKADMDTLMKESSIYLDAIPNDYSHEVVVTMAEVQLTDMYYLSDTLIEGLAKELDKMYESIGFTVTDYEIYNNSQEKFIKIYHNHMQNNSLIYSLQYYTINNSHAINYTLHSYDKKINNDYEIELKNIVDSIRFDNPPKRTEVTDLIEYIDKDTGLKFTVPENYTQTELSKEREFIDVKFVYNDDYAKSIMYGSTDLWRKLTASEKFGLSRSDIDSDYYSKEIYEELGENVESIQLGGRKYFKYTESTTNNDLGFDVSIIQTSLIHIDNGYYYLFMYFGDTKAKEYDDFINMVENAEYKESADKNISSSSISNRINWGAVGLSLVITLIAYCIFPIFFSIFRKKEIKGKTYTIICFAVNLVIMITFVAINGKASSGAPYLIWTTVFSNIGKSMLNKKGLIVKEKLSVESTNTVPDQINEIPSENNDNQDVTKPEGSISIKVKPAKRIQYEEHENKNLESMNYCRNCGAKIVEGSLFCSRCGTRL